MSLAGQRLASSFPGLGRDEMRTQDSGSQAHLSGSALSHAPSCPLTRGQKPWRGLNEQAWGVLRPVLPGAVAAWGGPTKTLNIGPELLRVHWRASLR